MTARALLGAAAVALTLIGPVFAHADPVGGGGGVEIVSTCSICVTSCVKGTNHCLTKCKDIECPKAGATSEMVLPGGLGGGSQNGGRCSVKSSSGAAVNGMVRGNVCALEQPFRVPTARATTRGAAPH